MLSALGFLTVVGPSRVPDTRTFRWFPLVGALIGLSLGGLWWVAARAFPPGLAAALVVVADLALTGLLHVDGLADSADGLLPPLSRERRLAIMRQPDIGAFAAAVVPAVLLVRWAALAGQTVSPLLLAGLWCASRTAIAVVPSVVRYARTDGLASAFLADGASPNPTEAGSGPAEERAGRVGRANGSSGRLAGAALVGVPGASMALALAVAGRGWVGVASIAVASGAAALTVEGARRRLGGFTGDVLGAAAVLAETVGLVAAAARW